MGVVRLGAKSEELIYDMLKLAIIEALFKTVELLRLGAVVSVVILVLVIYRHRQRLFRLGSNHAVVEDTGVDHRGGVRGGVHP